MHRLRPVTTPMRPAPTFFVAAGLLAVAAYVAVGGADRVAAETQRRSVERAES